MVKIPRVPISQLGERFRYWATVGISCVPPNRYRSIFILGYPRTGTNWLCSMLRDYFEIPISEPWARRLPAFEPVILHLHRFAVVPKRTIYMIRDPRDIVISHYHKLLPDPSVAAQSPQARFCDAPLTHENARANLPGYVRFLFEGEQPAAISMDRHFRKARALGLYTARYEDMLENGEETLRGIIEHLGAKRADPARIRDVMARNSFERHTGRKPGQEDSGAPVARKGIAGDWKNQFSHEAGVAFDRYAGDLLIEFGYESDRRWVETLSDSDAG